VEPNKRITYVTRKGKEEEKMEITISERLAWCPKCQKETMHRGCQMDGLKLDEHTQVDAWVETCPVCHTKSLWKSKETGGLIPSE